MSRGDVTAFLAMVQAVPNLRVGDAKAPADDTLPYVVAYPDQGVREVDNFAAQPTRRTTTVQLTAVGGSRDQAQWAAEKAADAVVGKRPTVPGRSCTRVEHHLTEPARRDDDETPPLFYAVDQYRFTSVTA